MMAWKDEDAIDTLAAAYAETGDFDLAVRYAAQALSVKGISAEDAKFSGTPGPIPAAQADPGFTITSSNIEVTKGSRIAAAICQ